MNHLSRFYFSLLRCVCVLTFDPAVKGHIGHVVRLIRRRGGGISPLTTVCFTQHQHHVSSCPTGNNGVKLERISCYITSSLSSAPIAVPHILTSRLDPAGL